MLASHIIFGCYGFWLPNDPRGSWSDYVRNLELLKYGPATKVNTSRSLARKEHDHNLRLEAKQSLSYPPVILNGIQARAVARGIARAVDESDYTIYACSIMPDHVHAVVAPHQNSPKRIIGHFKGRATNRLNEEGIHPLGNSPDAPSPWSRQGWSVYLDREDKVLCAIKYVQQNPIHEGLRVQKWWFVSRWSRVNSE